MLLKSCFRGFRPILVLGFMGCLLVGTVTAKGRRFGYSHEAMPHPLGRWHYEQEVTWQASKAIDSKFDRFDFVHEFEVGLTERLDMGVIVPAWRYQDGRSVDPDRVEFRALGVEMIYNLLHPVTDPFGLSVLGEAKVGDQLFELESGVLFQKGWGAWTLVYNIILEAEWEGSDYEEDHGVLEQSFGVSYQINPSFLVGAEMLHEIEFEDWDDTGDYVVYLGPNFSYRSEQWWVVLSPLFQVTDVDAESDFVTRIIFGLEF